jgi:hypothetical protein
MLTFHNVLQVKAARAAAGGGAKSPQQQEQEQQQQEEEPGATQDKQQQEQQQEHQEPPADATKKDKKKKRKQQQEQEAAEGSDQQMNGAAAAAAPAAAAGAEQQSSAAVEQGSKKKAKKAAKEAAAAAKAAADNNAAEPAPSADGQEAAAGAGGGKKGKGKDKEGGKKKQKDSTDTLPADVLTAAVKAASKKLKKKGALALKKLQGLLQKVLPEGGEVPPAAVAALQQEVRAWHGSFHVAACRIPAGLVCHSCAGRDWHLTHVFLLRQSSNDGLQECPDRWDVCVAALPVILVPFIVASIAFQALTHGWCCYCCADGGQRSGQAERSTLGVLLMDTGCEVDCEPRVLAGPRLTGYACEARACVVWGAATSRQAASCRAARAVSHQPSACGSGTVLACVTGVQPALSTWFTWRAMHAGD